MSAVAGDAESRRYAFAMESPRGALTGILVLADDGGEQVRGAMINEFGFSALDFIYNRKNHRVKLVNVIKFLDKWQVRYVLKRDLTAAMRRLDDPGADVGPRYEAAFAGDTLRLRNTRHGLSYSLVPMGGGGRRVAVRLDPVNIWDGTDVSANVRMTPYLAAGEDNTAVVVCPGGSYFWLDRSTEGHDVAEWLQSNGISAFVLEYRVAGVEAFITHSRIARRGNRYPDMLLDLQRAVSLVRRDSARYRVDPARVGVMGFSAGGHLVVMAGERFDMSGDTADVRPDFIASIYPVVTFTDASMHRRSRRGIMGEGRAINAAMADSLSLERHVRPDMPPVFLINCKDDPVVNYRNSELLDSALSAAGVPHLYIQYPDGGHGFGCTASKTSAGAATWPGRFLEWLDDLFPEK